MKILVMQLARFGDILQTWPTLRALKRVFPEAELHFLARAKFAAAVEGLDAIDQFWPFETQTILAPLVNRRPDLDQALDEIDGVITPLRNVGFDRVINLSFSPVSSYLVHAVSSSLTEISGYSRQRDGFLSIPDDASAYFYAQVGPARANRVHLTDLFAHIAGVDLIEADCTGPSAPEAPSNFAIKPGSIVVHIGASQAAKTLGWMKWGQIVKGLLQAQLCDVILIGTQEEAEVAAKIEAACVDVKPVNWVGRTGFRDLFTIVGAARLLVGGDSGPIHVASLTNTPVFNISFPSVSFWETGPRAAQSRVICVEEEAALPSDVCVSDIISVWREIAAAREGAPFVDARALLPSMIMRARTTGFELSATSSGDDFACGALDFQWSLIRAIYMGEAFPPAPDSLFLEGARRLEEVNHLALEQIQTLKRNQDNRTPGLILDRVDEIFDQIASMVPDLAPLVRWFQTERLRIGPMSMNEIFAITESLHHRFIDVLSLYTLNLEEPRAQELA